MTDQHDRAPEQLPQSDVATAPTTQETEPAEPEAQSTLSPEPTDEGGLPGEPVGNDNIRDGTVRGIMGGPHQSQGQGQGG